MPMFFEGKLKNLPTFLELRFDVSREWLPQ